MDLHQLSKLTTAARIPPVLPGTNRWKSMHPSSDEKKQHFQNMADYSDDDAIESNQLEPDNFQPMTNVERSNLQSFSFNHNSLSPQFLQKIAELKKEHQKTLTLLNQLSNTENKKSKSHKNARQNINCLAPDYLDYTENNTLYHGNVPDRGPDIVAGYLSHNQEKFPDERSDTTNETFPSEDIEQRSNADSVELVNQMWDHFSLDEYIDKGNMRPKKHMKPPTRPQSAPTKKNKEWTPVITIPKPFNMTIRDEKKKTKLHTRSSMEISERERIRAEAEEEERLKTIRAREPPSHIYLPLYEEMCERREQRSRFNRESSIAAALAIQKPFSFAERDAARLKEKKIKLKEKEENDMNRLKKRCFFYATPVPNSVYHSFAEDRRLEEALYRRIKAKLRSEDLMRTSQYPPRMQSHEKLAAKRRAVWKKELEKETAPTFKPKLSEMPDFEMLHRHGEMDAMTKHPPAETTVVKPFKFHSTGRSQTKLLERESLDSDWTPPKPQAVHRPGKMPVFSDTLPTRMSDSSRIRLDNMQRSLQEADHALKKKEREELERKERKRLLASKVQKKALTNNIAVTQATANEEKLRQYKKELRQRQINYNKFLDEVKRKVDERPLLFEQHDQKVAKELAERRYRQILESSGLSDDFVMNKSIKANSGDFDDSSSREYELINRSSVVMESDTGISAGRQDAEEKIV